MPVEETTNLNISCDNCGTTGPNNLDPNERTGWLFVTHEVYGQPVQQNVFCSLECASAKATDVAKEQAAASDTTDTTDTAPVKESVTS